MMSMFDLTYMGACGSADIVQNSGSKGRGFKSHYHQHVMSLGKALNPIASLYPGVKWELLEYGPAPSRAPMR